MRADGSRSASTARPTSSWRRKTPSSFSTANPCSRASSSPAARSASRTPSPWRGPLDDRGGPLVASDLERLGDGGDRGPRQRPTGRGQQAQHAPGLGRADGHPGEDQVLERGRQRDRRQLAPGGQELLGHERAATRPFDDDDQHAGRRRLPLDRLDEAGQVVPAERRQGQAIRLARGALEGPQVDGPRVVAADGIGLVGADDGQALGAGDPGEERRRACGSRRRRDGGPRSPAGSGAAPRAARGRPGSPRADAPDGAPAPWSGAGCRRRGSPGARPARASAGAAHRSRCP